MKNIKVYIIIFVLLLSAKLFAQVNPSLNYYPLHIGDEWQYKVTYFDTSPNNRISYLSKRVISDTILASGKRYFLIEQPPFTYDEIKVLEKAFVRVDSTNGVLYKLPYENGKEEKLDSLFCTARDYFFNGDLYCADVSVKNVFSQPVLSKIVTGRTSSNYGLFWRQALGIGIYYQENWIAIVTATGNKYDLTYAKINGVEYGQLVDVEDEKNFLPQEFSLSQNFPNPFNPSTTIKFSVPSVGAEHVQPLHVLLKVYDLLGREIATLVNEEKAPGNYEVTFNGESRLGESLPSGVYFYRLQARNYSLGAEQGFSATKKMIYLK